MNDSKPLTVEECDKLLQLLELVSQNIERLLNQGVVLTRVVTTSEFPVRKEKFLNTVRASVESRRRFRESENGYVTNGVSKVIKKEFLMPF